MPAAPRPPGQRVILAREGHGASGRIVEYGLPVLRGIAIDHPSLIVVLKGTKTLRWDGHSCRIEAGEAVALASGGLFDVENHPAPDGEYQASWFAWHGDALAAHAPAAGSRPVRDMLLLGAVEPAFMASFEHAREAIGDAVGVPDAIARHRLAELLAWIALRGGHFATNPQASVKQRVRALLGRAPEQDWSAAAVASALAMSEATLRRRLTAEASSLTSLLVDVRMSLALSLLQSTDRPIVQIAQDAGYASPSRFAVRFRERFGFAPTAVRGHQRDGASRPGAA